MVRIGLLLAVAAFVFIFSVQSVFAYTTEDLVNSLRNLFFPSLQSQTTTGGLSDLWNWLFGYSTACTCSGTNIEHCSTGCSNAGAVCNSPSDCIPVATTTTKPPTTTTKPPTTTTKPPTTTTKPPTTTTKPPTTTTKPPTTTTKPPTTTTLPGSTCSNINCGSANSVPCTCPGGTPCSGSYVYCCAYHGCSISQDTCQYMCSSTTTTIPGSTTTTKPPTTTTVSSTCSQYTSCPACADAVIPTSSYNCGWCKNLNQCKAGISSGPTDGSCSGSNWIWLSSQCSAETTTTIQTTCPSACSGYTLWTCANPCATGWTPAPAGDSYCSTYGKCCCSNPTTTTSPSCPDIGNDQMCPTSCTGACRCDQSSKACGPGMKCCQISNDWGCLAGSLSCSQVTTTTAINPCTAECAQACYSQPQQYTGSCCRTSCSGDTPIGQPGQYGCAANMQCCCWGGSGPCSDSDYGKNYLVQGTCTQGGSSYTDVCSFGGTLTERYCDSSNICSFESVNCANVCAGCVCINGACIFSSTTTTTTPGSTTTTTGSTTTTTPGSTTTTTGSTTTTTPGSTTTTTGSTTTTIPSGQFIVKCSVCQVGDKCHCNISTTCDEGIWILKNKEGTPLQVPITQNIPPIKVEFTPNATGKIEATAMCLKPAPPVSNTAILEVTQQFLKCPSQCDVYKECGCTVFGCEDGDFEAVLGSTILKKIKIDTKTFSTTFIPEKSGIIEVTADCNKPDKKAQTTIFVSGATTTTISEGKFIGRDFRCSSTSSGYRCSLDYDNRYGPAYLVFFFSNSGGEVIDSTDPPISVGSGSDSRYDDFTCSGRPGKYYVSWTAYSDRDLTNPIPGAWPNPDERELISCPS